MTIIFCALNAIIGILAIADGGSEWLKFGGAFNMFMSGVLAQILICNLLDRLE